jgi:hypothetical protein
LKRWRGSTRVWRYGSSFAWYRDLLEEMTEICWRNCVLLCNPEVHYVKKNLSLLNFCPKKKPSRYVVCKSL